MPEHVYFFHEDPGQNQRPTVTIYDDGTYKEHRSFKEAKKATVYLWWSHSSGPSRKQLDLAERFASAAIFLNSQCVLEFGPSTSPWTYDVFSKMIGDEFAQGFAGDGLKWGRRNSRSSGPLRTRKRPDYKPEERK